MDRPYVGPTPPDAETIRQVRETELREKLQSAAAAVGFVMAILTGVWLGWRWGVTLVLLLLLYGHVRKAGELGAKLKKLVEK